MIVYEVFSRNINGTPENLFIIKSLDLFTTEEELKKKYPNASLNDYPYEVGTFYRKRVVKDTPTDIEVMEGPAVEADK